MDAGQALAELTEISSQIELAVVFDSRGELIGSTLAERDVAEALVRGGSELFATAIPDPASCGVSFLLLAKTGRSFA